MPGRGTVTTKGVGLCWNLDKAESSFSKFLVKAAVLCAAGGTLKQAMVLQLSCLKCQPEGFI
jgi:hypothetical protein